MAFSDLIINGVCTGIGTGIGSYIATKYAIHHLQTVENKIRGVKKDESLPVRESK
jgi:hypothetical protein